VPKRGALLVSSWYFAGEWGQVYFLAWGLGLPCFSSLLAAAAFWSACFVAVDFLPGFGWQLPFSRGAFPGTGS
jgi:hypothetical protein